jgi:hypothetical protein
MQCACCSTKVDAVRQLHLVEVPKLTWKAYRRSSMLQVYVRCCGVGMHEMCKNWACATNVHRTKTETHTKFSEQTSTSCVYMFGKKTINKVPVQFSEQMYQGWPVQHGVQNVPGTTTSNYQNGLRVSESWECGQGCQPPPCNIPKT